MKKAAIALATAAALGAATLAMPSPAEAQSTRQILRGIGIGAAVVGGAALLYGAAAHAHLDRRYHPYAPVQGYYYVPGHVYHAAPPVACPNGFWAYRVNQYGQPYGQPRWICSPSGYHANSYVYR